MTDIRLSVNHLSFLGASPLLPCAAMPTLERPDATVHYVTEGDGTPIVMLQGVGVAGCGWRPQIDRLRARHLCVAIDNRGIGASTTRGPVSVEAMALDALAVMDELGLETAHVVGHSLGGVIAQALTLAAPSRVRSLALLCTFVRGRDGAALTPFSLWMGLRTSIGTRAMRRRAFVEMVSPRARLASEGADSLAAQLASAFGRDLADRPAVLMAQFRALGASDLSARLAEIAVPTLVVSAEEDRIAPPSQGRALAGAIGGARYEELAGESHACVVQAPERLDPLLASHLESAAR